MFAGWLPQGAEAVGQDVIILAAVLAAAGAIIVLLKRGAKWTVATARKVMHFFQEMAENVADVPKLRTDLQALAEERRADTAEFRAEIAKLREENSAQHAEARAEYGARFDAIESHLTAPSRKRSA
jgi:hypothetical protein